MSETVFIFHGRDDAAYASLEDFCTRLGLDAHNFRRVVDGSGPRPTIDIIDESVAKAKAIILLLTPDEYMVLDPRLGAETIATRSGLAGHRDRTSSSRPAMRSPRRDRGPS